MTELATQDKPNLPAISIKAAAIAHLTAREPEVRALAERYREVAYDLTTPKGLASAKAGRHDLRENGRFALQRDRDATKELLNTAKKDVEAEAERLIAIVKPVEDAIQGQIEVREAELAAEKAERERKEQERQAAHRAAIAKIKAYSELAVGLPAARIAGGVELVQAIAIDPAAWEEFAAEAEAVKADTLAQLQRMHAQALANEEAARIREAERLEHQRQAAELAAQQKAIAAEQARIAAERAELDALRKKIEDEQAAVLAKAIDDAQAASMIKAIEETPLVIPAEPPPEVTAILERANAQAAEVRADIERITDIRTGPLGQPADTRPPINLGEIAKRLGFSLSADFIAIQLGIPYSHKERAATYWPETDFGRICAALVAHIQAKAGA